MTRLLVISAHAADFVWRAAGAIATVENAAILGAGETNRFATGQSCA